MGITSSIKKNGTIEFTSVEEIYSNRKAYHLPDPFDVDAAMGTCGNISWVERLNQPAQVPTAKECAEYEKRMIKEAIRHSWGSEFQFISNAATRRKEWVLKDLHLAIEVGDMTLAAYYRKLISKYFDNIYGQVKC